MTTDVAERPGQLGVQELAILLAGRLVLNTAFRVVYPLLPFLAEGLQVSLSTVSLLVTIQVAAALISPLGGTLSDARGERFTLLLGLAVFCAGALACALAQGFGPFLLGYGLIGLGTSLYMPAGQAYVSARSGYAQRGRVLGILELSWAAAALVGVTGLTQLVELRGSWGPVFWVLLGLGLAVLALTMAMPRERAGPGRRAAAAAGPGLRVLGRPEVRAALGLVFLQLLAVELVLVSYASWLKADFAASTEQLGLIYGLMGFVELAGAIGATLLADRLGKRRAVLAGFAAVAALMALLPLSAGSWALFLPLFLIFDLCFEFAIVSVFPLISGLAREGRGTVLALGGTTVGVGRIVGSLAGPWVFLSVGFGGNGLLAGALALAGVLVGLLFVREGDA